MKTTKPVRILVVGMEMTPALEQLVLDGHSVHVLPEFESDMLIGPKCWRYLPDISDKWLTLLVKEARAAQPPRVKKAKVKKSGTAAG